MEQNYWELGRWGRIPVSMHWTVLLIFVWLYLFFWDVVATAIASVAFFALLVAHEYGHVAALRWRKIPVERIELFGIHGKTSYGYASPADEILVAWSGVGAQLLILLLSVVVAMTIDLSGPVAATIAGPILIVFTKLNIVLMIIALLPIGPFDGRAAWGVFAYARAKRKRVRQRQRDIELNPEKGLTPEKRRELEESASKEAAALMEKFARKKDGRKEDA
jgi:Zn-dependent protease